MPKTFGGVVAFVISSLVMTAIGIAIWSRIRAAWSVILGSP